MKKSGKPLTSRERILKVLKRARKPIGAKDIYTKVAHFPYDTITKELTRMKRAGIIEHYPSVKTYELTENLERF